MRARKQSPSEMPGATVLEIDGVGHGVDGADWPTIGPAILHHTAAASSGSEGRPTDEPSPNRLSAHGKHQARSVPERTPATASETATKRRLEDGYRAARSEAGPSTTPDLALGARPGDLNWFLSDGRLSRGDSAAAPRV